MNETEMLKRITKTKSRDPNTIKYGMFGLSLGEVHYQRLNDYCTKHNLYKATLVRNLVVDYLDKAEQQQIGK